MNGSNVGVDQDGLDVALLEGLDRLRTCLSDGASSKGNLPE